LKCFGSVIWPLEARRFFCIAANPTRLAIAVPRSVIVVGSGTAFRPVAVICPLPEVATVAK